MTDATDRVSQDTSGTLDAWMVVPIYSVLGEMLGEVARDRIFADAGLADLPGENSRVPEKQVAHIHRMIWTDWPDAAHDILDQSGRVAGEVFVTQRVTPKARALLQNMPWSVSAWLVGKTVRLYAGSFSGSSLFAIQTTSRFALFNNALARPAPLSAAGCHFYRAFFEHIFQRLAHRDFTCEEMSCVSCGDACCAFQLTL